MAKPVYDHRWRKVSEAIRHATPYCEDCMDEGTVTTAEDMRLDVDHIIPIEVDPSKKYDADNLRVRCIRHHSIKTCSENNHWNNRELRKPKQWWLSDEWDSDASSE
ncbi:HNH endonuclease [Gluconobacter albidus]|uniref:HNH endonuclease n=1 Tax=Gluconobacter albidus TaxID=318683 RepID=UPI000784017B|nr:HNH endonuclease [Gluconobacter albidus]